MFTRGNFGHLVLWAALLLNCASHCDGRRKRLPIPTSLRVYDAKGINVIVASVDLVYEAGIFPEDYNFMRRIALTEEALNRTSTNGGLWNVDECAFRDVTQNIEKYTRLPAMQKSIKRTFGIKWSKLRHTELRKPLYSLLAARIFLALTVTNPPRGLRHQGRVWSQQYHACSRTDELGSPPHQLKRMEDRFVKVAKSSCDSGYTECDHFCHRRPRGKVQCSCRDGYVLQDDGRSCTRMQLVNRTSISTDVQSLAPARPTPPGCEKNGHECEHACFEHTGQCVCRRGYKLHENGYSCQDIDECQFKPCAQRCHNTVGSFQCTCRKRFTLQPDGRSCRETKPKNCDNDIKCRQKCKVEPDTGLCACPAGRILGRDGQTCQEPVINACAQFPGVCHHTCVDVPRGYICSCAEGYSLDENGSSCSDIDECASGRHSCHHGCVNTPGSFVCSCGRGFRLDADLKTCVDIDECAFPGKCPHPSKCKNTIGDYKCECPKGFVEHRQQICVDDDECQTENGGCAQTCHNFPGSYRCSCSHGYSMHADGKSCTDIDECSVYRGLCQHTCLNTPGSFQCVCPTGQRQHPNGFICEDIYNH